MAGWKKLLIVVCFCLAALAGWFVWAVNRNTAIGRIVAARGAAIRLMVGLRLYADAHNGTYPETLDQLIEDAPSERDVYRTLPDGTKQARWRYFPENVAWNGVPKPIFASVFTIADRCIVGMSDTDVQVWHVEQWQDWLQGRPSANTREGVFDRRLQSELDWIDGKYDKE